MSENLGAKKRGLVLPIAAYLPFLPRRKNIVVIPPKTPVDKTDVPTIPSAANTGVPEPVASLCVAISTLILESFIPWYSHFSETSYCANAGFIVTSINASDIPTNKTDCFCM